MSDPFKDAIQASGDEEAPLVAYWCKEIDLSKKREKRFRKEAEKVLKIYEAAKEDDNNFNILYSNTATLLPAVYNQTPRAIVERRFHDPDPLAKAASETLERTLSYLLDASGGGYEQYDDLFQQAALGAFLPGRGVTRFKYDPEIESSTTSLVERTKDEGETDETKQIASEQEISGELLPKRERVVWETVCGQDVDYDRFLMGYARRWVDVPWVAYEHAMSKEDAVANFGEGVAGKMKFVAQKEVDSSGRKVEDDELNNRGSTDTATVYEIWWKQKRKIVFFDPELKEQLCKVVDDPYKLSGFFDCPEPLRFYQKRTTLVPTPLYKAYEVQARQLNRLTMRISRVTNALKVRGFYDGTVQGLKELLNAEDNTMIAAKNVASMKDGAGSNLSNSIWFMPLEILANVLQELYKAQENCKSTIYEITGIADIMRGDTQASETATAQNIKDKWGSLRLQEMQGVMQKYVRDCLRIVGELAGEHFGLETFAAMTNLDFATPQQVAQATQVMQQVQQAMLQQPPSQPPAPGGPPAAPPAPPPQIQQMAQQAQAILAKPQWSAVLQLLKNDMMRGYRIDIETNSTLANTSNEDQANITQAMQALSNMFTSFLPAVQGGALTMPALKEMTLSVARRFEFGRQVESSIAAMPDQLPPPPPDPKVNEEMQKQQQALQAQEQDIAAQHLELQGKAQELAGRETAMAQKAQEISKQVTDAMKGVADATQKARDAQEIAQEKFMTKVEQRIAKAEIALEKKGLMQQKAQATAQAAEKVVPADTTKTDNSLRELHDAMQELTKARKAPIKFIKGPDGKTSHVDVGGVLKTIKRDPKSREIIELH